MKAFLMYKDKDFDQEQPLPWNQQALIQDLELDTLFEAMAQGDKFLFEVAKKAALTSLTESGPILYRQDILKDCLRNPSIVKDIYTIAVASIEAEKKNYLGFLHNYPAWILDRSLEVMQMFVGMLKKLRNIAGTYSGSFESAGFTAFFAMLNQELGDDYFAAVHAHLKELKFRDGVLISAELGKGNKGSNYILRKPPPQTQSWLERIFTEKPPAYTYYVPERDESGARTLSELKDRGINLVANALAQSTDHILSFFKMLRTELAFYIGCLNLNEQLIQKGEPVAFPLPAASGERIHSFMGLYDACLTLNLEQGRRAVGNAVNADGKDFVIITGANQGGKSTFLRSIGLAQLMMQCGMFVPADAFRANICEAIFTHYKREEDVTMSSGKFDEELSRMSEIVDHLTPNSLVLFNESFAATNEREGSEIGRQIVKALLDKRIKVFFVTHLYEFAHSFYSSEMENGKALFLRAERQADGGRTFKIKEGEPLQTSFGKDLYNKVFLKSL